MASKPPFVGERIAFVDAFKEVSRGVAKIKQADYLPHGRHPIIDQGKGMIAGYSNAEEGLFTDVPAIVFGDHTRCVKYVSESFFAGADGVKILKPLLSDNVRYWYHALRSVRLDNLGYSRHYKLLKQTTFAYVDEDIQSAVCDVLDSILAAANLARCQLPLLDGLVKSRFVEMFESTKWSTAPAGSVLLNMRNGVSPSKAGAFRARVLTLSAITQGFFDAESWKEGTFSSDPPRGKRISAGEFYICRGNGNRDLVGAGEYSDIDYLDLVFPDTMIAARINLDLINAAYLRYAWTRPAVRRQIESRVRTTNGTFKINQRMLSEVLLPIPPLSLQREFAAFAAEVAKSRVVVKKQALKYNDVIRASSETAIIRRGGLA